MHMLDLSASFVFLHWCTKARVAYILYFSSIDLFIYKILFLCHLRWTVLLNLSLCILGLNLCKEHKRCNLRSCLFKFILEDNTAFAETHEKHLAYIGNMLRFETQ